VRKRAFAALLIAVLGASSGCAESAPAAGAVASRVALRPAGGGLTDALIDSLDHVGDVAWDGSHLVLTDVRSHRLLQLSPGRGGMLQGRRGQGPAEFAFPLYADARGDRIIVGDQGNGRFQEFDRAGHLVRVINAPFPVRHFVIESDTTVLAALADSVWYLARLFPSGQWEPVARRPAVGVRGGVASNGRGDHLVAIADSGRIAVFDQALGQLQLYSAGGEYQGATSLPGDIASSLAQTGDEQRAVMEKRFGQVLSAPTIKDLAGDGRGHLLLLFSADTNVGVWLDLPRGRSAVLSTDAANGDDPFWSAVAGDVSGDSVVLVSRDGKVYVRELGNLGLSRGQK